MSAPKGPMIRIDGKFYSMHPKVAEELNRLRRELWVARVQIGLINNPDQQYNAGTPVFEFMREMNELRDFRKQVVEALSSSTEYYQWADAIEDLDRLRRKIAPLLAEIKTTKEQA